MSKVKLSHIWCLKIDNLSFEKFVRKFYVASSFKILRWFLGRRRKKKGVSETNRANCERSCSQSASSSSSNDRRWRWERGRKRKRRFPGRKREELASVILCNLGKGRVGKRKGGIPTERRRRNTEWGGKREKKKRERKKAAGLWGEQQKKEVYWLTPFPHFLPSKKEFIIVRCDTLN